MANLKNWIEEEAGGEYIEAISVGPKGWHEEDVFPLSKNIPLNWNDVAPYLDYEFDSGYGSPNCHAIFAWTKSKVIFVSQYDGATGICSIPRNPEPSEPYMPGG